MPPARGAPGQGPAASSPDEVHDGDSPLSCYDRCYTGLTILEFSGPSDLPILLEKLDEGNEREEIRVGVLVPPFGGRGQSEVEEHDTWEKALRDTAWRGEWDGRLLRLLKVSALHAQCTSGLLEVVIMAIRASSLRGASKAYAGHPGNPFFSSTNPVPDVSLFWAQRDRPGQLQVAFEVGALDEDKDLNARSMYLFRTFDTLQLIFTIDIPFARHLFPTNLSPTALPQDLPFLSVTITQYARPADAVLSHPCLTLKAQRTWTYSYPTGTARYLEGIELPLEALLHDEQLASSLYTCIHPPGTRLLDLFPPAITLPAAELDELFRALIPQIIEYRGGPVMPEEWGRGAGMPMAELVTGGNNQDEGARGTGAMVRGLMEARDANMGAGEGEEAAREDEPVEGSGRGTRHGGIGRPLEGDV
ncbi:hypothetical protein JCM11251_000995 [Rhodosporidiobolus azoricus]